MIDLNAHKPTVKNANYTIDLHLFAQSDSVFASRKHKIVVASQDSYSFTSDRSVATQKFISTLKQIGQKLTQQVLVNK